jgi:hypothetical protein
VLLPNHRDGRKRWKKCHKRKNDSLRSFWYRFYGGGADKLSEVASSIASRRVTTGELNENAEENSDDSASEFCIAIGSTVSSVTEEKKGNRVVWVEYPTKTSQCTASSSSLQCFCDMHGPSTNERLLGNKDSSGIEECGDQTLGECHLDKIEFTERLAISRDSVEERVGCH